AAQRSHGLVERLPPRLDDVPCLLRLAECLASLLHRFACLLVALACLLERGFGACGAFPGLEPLRFGRLDLGIHFGQAFRAAARECLRALDLGGERGETLLELAAALRDHPDLA